MKNIIEAKRYMSNAREILKEKAINEGGFYKYRKCVKIAGRTAYAGVLVALDSIFKEKTKNLRSLDWYTEKLLGVDNKILSVFLAAYDTLYLSMSYDGNLSVVVSKEGLKMADKIIDWAEQNAHA